MNGAIKGGKDSGMVGGRREDILGGEPCKLERKLGVKLSQ